jgi:hypothetical protein
MSSYAIDDRQISIALQTHMGLGAVMMGGFSYIFARSYYSTKKEQSRIFKALPLAATFFKLFYYLINIYYARPCVHTFGPYIFTVFRLVCIYTPYSYSNRVIRFYISTRYHMSLYTK